jgi:antitoxin (DNA-binding transcriptional repressor) of toxin-antitoxin stability system
MKTVTTHHAKTHLSRLLKDVQAGEEIVIRSGNLPVARLTAFEQPPRKRPPVGRCTSGPVTYSDDAFEPLSDDELRDGWAL